MFALLKTATAMAKIAVPLCKAVCVWQHCVCVTKWYLKPPEAAAI